MRALFVVVVAELVELVLQVGDGAGGRPGGQPALEGLVEALGLALGLGVAGGSVLLVDAEQRQEVFDGVARAAEAGGGDAAVVGQRAGRGAVLVDSGEEGGDDVVTADGSMGGAGEQVAGVVVEPGQDLDVGRVLKAPVAEVRLPHLVGLGHLKARVGASGALAWLRGDQSGVREDPADRRWRPRLVALALQVPGDRHRPGVQPVGGQLHAQLDHARANLVAGRRRRGLGTARPWLQRVQAPSR